VAHQLPRLLLPQRPPRVEPAGAEQLRRGEPPQRAPLAAGREEDDRTGGVAPVRQVSRTVRPARSASRRRSTSRAASGVETTTVGNRPTQMVMMPPSP